MIQPVILWTDALVFLLIGLSVNLPQLWASFDAIIVAVVAVLAGRAVVVYGMSKLVKK